jgi:hypothetical protein
VHGDVAHGDWVSAFVDAHPIVATILGLPIVVTACLIVAGMCGVELSVKR